MSFPRSRSPGRRGKEPARPQSSPIDRDHVAGQMQDIFAVVKKLREEKTSLEMQLKNLGAHTEMEEKRLIKDLCKSRTDLENLSDLFRLCVDGMDTKTTANIPELPEAAVAKVVPRGLRSLLEQDYGEHASAGKTIQEEIGHTHAAINDALCEYERVAESGKGLVWDVERLNMIIQAYEGDLIKLRDEGAEVKAVINAARLDWRNKFSAVRRWQDFTRRSGVLKFQEKLDSIQDAFDLEQAESEAEMGSLFEMIGTVRARDNKVKLTLFLKRMKNSKLFKVWRGWLTFHQIIQREKYGDELERIRQLEAEKLAKMKDVETSAMLRCFIKRWQNRKIAIPFMTWAQIVIDKREAQRLADVEAQRAALFSRLQALDGGGVAQKLKLHFAKIAGKMKDLCFRALMKHMQTARIARMGEGERFKRLKVFLAGKLKGVKYATFKALERESRELRSRRVKNNDMAKKVGAFLEMKVKGLKFALFSAFKRHAVDSKADRGEEDRLAELIKMRDSQSMQRLKIFLQGKEMRMKYSTFSWWVACAAGGAEHRLKAQLADKRKAREALEARLAGLENELSGGRGTRDVQASVDDAQDRLAEARKRAELLARDLEAAKQMLQKQEDSLAQQQDLRRQAKLSKTRLLDDIAHAREDKEGLEAELALIVDQIGFLSSYSQ